jgi:hypothetical protein
MLMTADPEFQQSYDDQIRKTNGPASSTQTGTLDSCGWQVTTPALAVVSNYMPGPSLLWLLLRVIQSHVCCGYLRHVRHEAMPALCREASCLFADDSHWVSSRCERQADTPAQAPAALQWTRRTTPFYDDFSKGFLPENWVVGTGYKGW